MNSLYISIGLSAFFLCLFAFFQVKNFLITRYYADKYMNFFSNTSSYSTYDLEIGEGWKKDHLTQLNKPGEEGSDLNKLIDEINHYVKKTKGTTDFSIIQNKVERKIQMRYDQATARISFPTHLGLMGTFLGVGMGIGMFLLGFDGVEGITDSSIKNLLMGVLVSMTTSLLGLFLTTNNTALVGEARKKVEEDKNDFYDFVQTELMPSLDSSMTKAVAHLHETVSSFAPSFDKVIGNFQRTFDKCTSAFGDSFEKNVTVVADAVRVMGKNMDKINENVRQQERILDTLRGNQIVRGLEKYIEAAEHFAGITKSLDKFEEARRMMLAATQEVINYQEQYNEMLTVPREVAVRINQILDRIKDFEDNVNRLGAELSRRDMTSAKEIEVIDEILKALKKKEAIADKFLQIGDDKLEQLYDKQSKVIDEMSSRYATAIHKNIDEFENVMQKQLEEVSAFHQLFKDKLEEKFNIEDVRKEFSQLSNLKLLNDILEKQSDLSNLSLLKEVVAQLKSQTNNGDPVKAADLSRKLNDISESLKKIEEKKTSVKLFG